MSWFLKRRIVIFRRTHDKQSIGELVHQYFTNFAPAKWTSGFSILPHLRVFTG
jgi:hypothetical protein